MITYRTDVESVVLIRKEQVSTRDEPYAHRRLNGGSWGSLQTVSGPGALVESGAETKERLFPNIDHARLQPAAHLGPRRWRHRRRTMQSRRIPADLLCVAVLHNLETLFLTTMRQSMDHVLPS